MRDWYIKESVNKETKEHEAYILCGDDYVTRKKIYPDPKNKCDIILYILYNKSGKTSGYCFCYKYDKNYPKFSTYNSFGIVYNMEDDSQYDVEVIFEDSNIRLLAFDHKNSQKDYFLVGRWRNVNTIIS